MSKPFAPSCERNQQIIYQMMNHHLEGSENNLLEIGSGTGQHAVYMAPQMPSITWHCSDLIENHQGINQWLDEACIKNIRRPIVYQAGVTEFPKIDIDVVFSANTLHIMSWQNVRQMIKHFGDHLKLNAKIFIYGPFNYQGQYTSESNKEFDQWLKQEGGHRAIRDFEAVELLMNQNGIYLIKDIEMPSNNRLLYFVKRNTLKL